MNYIELFCKKEVFEKQRARDLLVQELLDFDIDEILKLPEKDNEKDSPNP